MIHAMYVFTLVFIFLLKLSLSIWLDPFFLSDWEEEQVSSPNILRLIYQGRFLHGNVTLGGEKTHRTYTFIDTHTKSQQRVAGKFFAVLIFFLSHRTEVPQCSGQACFDGEREERGNTGKEGKEAGQERGSAGIGADSGSTKQRQKEGGHEFGCHK